MKTSTPLYSQRAEPYLETHWHAVKQIRRDLANKAVLQALWPQKLSPSLSLNYKKPTNILRECRWSLLSSFKRPCQTGKMTVFSGRTENTWGSHQEQVPTGGHPLRDGRALDCTTRHLCFSEPNSAQWEEPHYQEAEAGHWAHFWCHPTVQKLTVFKRKSTDTTKDGSRCLE